VIIVQITSGFRVLIFPDGFVGNDESVQPAVTEAVDERTDERETELAAKSSVEVCSSLGCLSPLASTDALLPSFQPDDDDANDVKSPQPSAAAAEHSQRNYPGSAPQFAARRNRSPRSDELYSAPGHAVPPSYAGHSPRPEVATSALHRSSYSEQVSRSSPRSSGVVVEDFTSHLKHDWPTVESHRDQQTTGDSNVSRVLVKSNMDLLSVDTSPNTVNRQWRDTTANRVS